MRASFKCQWLPVGSVSSTNSRCKPALSSEFSHDQNPTRTPRYRSLRHDIVCAYHFAPAPGFVLNEGSRFGRRSAIRLDIECAEALLHVGHLEHLDRRLGDLILQFRLELGRSDHRVPSAREKVGKPD